MNLSNAKSRIAPHEWRWIYAAIVVLVAALWLRTIGWPTAVAASPAGAVTTVAPLLSPIIAFALLIALLRPFAGTHRHRTFVIAGTAVMVLWLFRSLGSILAPFIVAFVIAYILHPLVDRLQKRGMRRGIAVAIVIVPILAGIILGLGFGLPALAVQLESLVRQLPEAVQRVIASVETLRARLASSQLPFLSGEQLSAQMQIDETKIAAFVQQQQQAIASRAWRAVLGVGKGLSFLLTLVGYLVLTPVLIIYLLKDYSSLSEKIREMMPVRQRARWLAFLREFDALLSLFLRGQLIAAIIVGVMTWLGLLMLGVPYSGLVGVIAAVFNLIPYLGLVVSIIPVLIIAVLSGDFLSIISRSGIVFFVVQLIDSTITGPRIVGGSIGIHPVVVILALAVGSFYFGFVGLLLALPGAILIKLLLRNAIVRYKSSPLYLGEEVPIAE